MQEKEQQFDVWMNGYLSGELSDEEQAKLFALTNQDPLYKAKFHRMARLNALLHVPVLEAEADQQYTQLRKKIAHTDHPSNRLGLRIWLRFGAAAVILMLLSSALSTYFYTQWDEKKEEQLCETMVPFGCQTQIRLPDSSLVVLNSGSILRYPTHFGKKERTVYLEGEGYFEVTKAQEHPFRVQSGQTRVQVTGTTFTVRAYPDDAETEVYLIEGGVQVWGGTKTVTLGPDEKAVFNRKHGTLSRLVCESYKSALWTTGKLCFVNTPFPEMLKSIERKYNVKIQIASQNVRSDLFSGTIHADMPLQEVFNFIDMDKRYRFEHSGSTIILRDR